MSYNYHDIRLRVLTKFACELTTVPFKRGIPCMDGNPYMYRRSIVDLNLPRLGIEIQPTISRSKKQEKNQKKHKKHKNQQKKWWLKTLRSLKCQL